MIPARGWLVVAVAIAILFFACSHSRAHERPTKLDCGLIKWGLENLGEETVKQMARAQGWTDAQIEEARKKCKL